MGYNIVNAFILDANVLKENPVQSKPKPEESKLTKRKYTKRKTKDIPITSSNATAEVETKLVPQPHRESVKRVNVTCLKTRSHVREKLVIRRRLYVKIKKQILDAYKRRHRKVRRKVKPQKDKENVAPNQNGHAHEDKNTPMETLPKQTTAFEEINELNPINSDLSSDLFVALPQVASNSGSLSPTEAFLMNFPVVSGTLVSSGKGIEHADSQSPAVVSEPNPPRAQPIGYSSNELAKGNSRVEKCPDVISGSFSSAMAGDPHYDLMNRQPTFTFSLTAMISHSQEKDKLMTSSCPTVATTTQSESDFYRPVNLTETTVTGSSLSTDTKTTNSWSYNNRKKINVLEGPEAQTYSVQQHFMNSTPFTFSLTKASNSEPTNTTDQMNCNGIFNAVPPQVTNCSLFDGYNASSFNTYSNSFLGASSVLPTDCQYSTNAFSFQLTSSSSSQPTYTSMPSSQNALYLPAVSSATRKSYKPSDPSGRKEKPIRKSNAQDSTKRKSGQIGLGMIQDNSPITKSHVNWMTDPPDDLNLYSGPAMSVNQPCSSQFPPPPVPHTLSSTTPRILRGDDYNQKSDIFFAHPLGEERFLWENDRTPRHSELNAPSLLPTAPPPTFGHTDTLLFANQPTSSAVLKPSHSNNISDQYQPNGNDFSVSNLVGSSKKVSNSKHSTLSDSNTHKWKGTRTTNWDAPCHKNAQSLTPKPASSNSYSAEALIRSHQSSCAGTSLNEPYKTTTFKQNSYYLQDSMNTATGGDGSDLVEYNYNLQSTSSTQIGGLSRAENNSKLTTQSLVQEPYPFYHNDFIQPSLFPTPSLPLLPEPAHGIKSNSSKIGSISGSKRKPMMGEDGTESQIILPPNSTPMGLPPPLPPGTQTNYDMSNSSTFFPSGTSHSQPPPFLINPEPFNYHDNCKLPQPFVAAPPLDFNVTPAGPSSNFTTNYLTNFHLSSICPEINHSIN